MSLVQYHSDRRGGTTSVIVAVIAIIIAIMAILYAADRTDTDQDQEAETTPTNTTTEPYVAEPKEYVGDTTALPAPTLTGTVSVEEALENRRSARAFLSDVLTEAQLSQLLWAAQGVTDNEGHRTAPSARSLYPIEVYAAVTNVGGLAPGLYHYIPDGHRLGLVTAGEGVVAALKEAQSQDAPKQAPVTIVITGIYDMMRASFGDNAEKVVAQESGHVGQNMYLQAEASDLGMVVMTGFDAAAVGEAIGLPSDETILYLVPIGHPTDDAETE